MPSFDVVSEVNVHELKNAIDQANREVDNRFDFKGCDAKFEQTADATITLRAPNDFQIKQMQDILRGKIIKRDIDIRCLDFGKNIETSLNEARQTVTVQQGIDKEQAKKIIKCIKNSKTKVQTAIQEEQIRVTGKKRDDLQSIIALLKESKFEFPLQFGNFRD